MSQKIVYLSFKSCYTYQRNWYVSNDKELIISLMNIITWGFYLVNPRSSARLMTQTIFVYSYWKLNLISSTQTATSRAKLKIVDNI